MKASRLIIGTLAATSLVAASVVGISGVAAAAPVACPTAFPTAAAVDGVTGTGYTVERGTTPAPFSATILGRITDGIAPGIDMIIADLDSPALTRAGGVWAGMSGSPVYAADGRLIGSVSYGLSFAPSSIAGLTPGADLLDVATSPDTAKLSKGAGLSKIKVSAKTAGRLARTGEVTEAQASSGFTPIKVPVSVSGTGKRTAKFLERLSSEPGLLVRSAGSVKAAASSPSEITAGSNFVAALSYGDATLAATGTTTLVCAGKAVAFGHPLLANGPVTYTAHPASAVYVQPDPVFGPFKVANPGGPVGTVTRDRLTGLLANLGATPSKPFTVTSSLLVNGTTVTGTTTGSYQPWADSIAATHLYSNIVKALKADGAGSAALTYTIKGQTSTGTPFTLVRSDHYSDNYYISYAAADQLYFLLGALVQQDLDNATITSVAVTGSVSSSPKSYRVTKVELKKGTTYIPVPKKLSAAAGSTLTFRFTAAVARTTETVQGNVSVTVPAKTKGATGSVSVSDAFSAAGYYEGENTGDEATTFAGLLAELAAAPTYDSIVASVAVDKVSGATVTAAGVRKLKAPVNEFYKDYLITVT